MTGKRPSFTAAAIPPEYRTMADEAARLMTPAYVKRGLRILQLGPTGYTRFREVKLVFEQITANHGLQAAVDMFEQTLTIWQSKMPKTPGKRKGAHDTGRDKILLAMFDERDPDSPISLAKKGLLPLGVRLQMLLNNLSSVGTEALARLGLEFKRLSSGVAIVAA